LVRPKTAKAARQVPLPDSVVKFLAAHKLRSAHSAAEDFVFANRSGKGLSHRNVQQRGFDRAADLAGIEGVTFHDLRHAFASRMIYNGINSTDLAAVMGHESSTITERVYIHQFNRLKRDDKLRAAMGS
jgi:integrase